MDTLVTVQKLCALIHDSPVSSSDVFVEPTKESHSVVQSPVVEVNPQDIRISHSPASSVNSVHSTSQEQLSRATIRIPKAFFRTLSRYSSRQSRMLGPGWKGKHQDENPDVSVHRREVRASMMSAVSRTGSTRRTRPGTIWTEDDTFLPRAKPPPPLKRIKHARNHSEHSVPPDQTLPCPLPTSHCGSSGQSSISDSVASHFPRRSFDMQALERSSEHGRQPPADGPRPLRRRASTRTTTGLKGSDESGMPFSPSDLHWQPPNSWFAGPSRAASTEEDRRLKLFDWFTRRKSADGAMGGNTLPTRLNRARSLKKMKHVHSVAEEPKEEESTQRESLSSGVVVKIQCHELGDGWHERPMVDIIPKLRELKIK